MLEDNKEIILTGEEAINIMKEINYVLCSLHDMGSYFYEKDRRDYERETTNFIDNSLVTCRLANVRHILTEKFNTNLGEDDMDDIEREMEHIPYWEKPGDFYDGKL